MTRSNTRMPAAAQRRRSGRTAASVACVALALGVGCTPARRDLPAPRLPDEKALRAEAAATPAAPEPLYQLALLHYGERRPDSALGALRESLARDAAYAPSLALLAKLLHDTGRSREGVRYFEKRGIDTLPEPVRLNVALLYVDVGNTMKARKILGAIASAPWTDAAQVNLAYLDLVDEDHVAAGKRLQSGLGRYGDAPEAVNNRALAHLRAGDVESGARLLKDLAARHPEFGAAQLNLGLLLRHYLFDAAAADRAQAHFDALGTPRIEDAAWQRFDGPAHEDAAPAVPEQGNSEQPEQKKPVPPGDGGRR